MAYIGRTAGTVKVRVRRIDFNAAAWTQNAYIEMSSANSPSLPTSGFIYLSSETVNANIVSINLKIISESSFPFPYIAEGSYFYSNNGTRVNVSGNAISVTNNNTIVNIVSSAVEDDLSLPRHEIYNRDLNGVINNANPFNSFLPNSLFSNVNVSWINIDSRSAGITYIGAHGVFNSLVVPITRRHGLMIGSLVPSSLRYIDFSGSESIISISDYKTIDQAYGISGIQLPSSIPSSIASEMKILKFSTNIPSSVSRVSFANSIETFKKAIELPIYMVTFTRKIGLFSSSQYGEYPFVCTENLPLNSRLTGINASTDFVNYMHPQEKGHAIFAWDGQKSIFLGFVTSNILSTAIDAPNGVWNGVVNGFNSQGLPATSINDSQNLLISFFNGYQIALEENIENFQNVLTNGNLWQDPSDGDGLSTIDNIGEINSIVSAPIFQNPSIGRKKIIQSLRT